MIVVLRHHQSRQGISQVKGSPGRCLCNETVAPMPTFSNTARCARPFFIPLSVEHQLRDTANVCAYKGCLLLALDARAALLRRRNSIARSLRCGIAKNANGIYEKNLKLRRGDYRFRTASLYASGRRVFSSPSCGGGGFNGRGAERPRKNQGKQKKCEAFRERRFGNTLSLKWRLRLVVAGDLHQHDVVGSHGNGQRRLTHTIGNQRSRAGVVGGHGLQLLQLAGG